LTLLIGALLTLAACNLSNVPPTVVPTPDLPRVSFQSPANEAEVSEGTDLDIQVVAEDSGIGVARVELLADEQHVQDALPRVSAAVPIFTADMNWYAKGVGLHSLTVIAYRPDNTQSDPAIIIIHVVPAGGTATPGGN
jgi:hypothetical protein